MKEKSANPKAPMPEATPGAKPTGKPTKSNDYAGEPVASKAGGKGPLPGGSTSKKGMADKSDSHGGKPGSGKGGL